jgi:hypothetical protein
MHEAAGPRKLPCSATGLSPMHGRMRWLDAGSPVRERESAYFDQLLRASEMTIEKWLA